LTVCQAQTSPIDMISHNARTENSEKTSTNETIKNCQLSQEPKPEHMVHTNKNDERNDINDYRFHIYQSEMWDKRFQDLLQFRQRTGHCQVPFTYVEDPSLARWVKRQRYQYKLRLEGKQCTMTDERVQALESIGFVWDSQEAAWWDKFADLIQFKSIHSHCNIPSRYSSNPQLSIWVKCQRRQYRFFMERKPTNMTRQRIRDLEGIGFQWMIRSYHNLKKEKRSGKISL